MLIRLHVFTYAYAYRSIGYTINGNVCIGKFVTDTYSYIFFSYSLSSYKTQSGRAMAVKSIAVLLIPFLVIVTVELKSSKPKNCKLAVPSKCINNSVIMVNKTAEKYIIQLNASLCHNGYCIPDYEYTYRSNCEDICNLCKLLQLTGKSISYTHYHIQSYIEINAVDCKKCEDKVDKYLNNLCAKITSMVTLFNITNTTVTTVTQPCPMSTNGVSWMTTTNTPKTTCTNRSTCNPSGSQYSTTTSHRQTASTTHTPTQSTESQSAVNTMPVQVLGALLGLSMVLLVIVTTGWVCTCLFMKNSKVKMNCVQDRYYKYRH